MTNHDKSFDGLAVRFAQRVYGNVKGEIRLKILWRDITEQIPELITSKPLRILDIGGGLGQLSVELAKHNNQVVYNDISPEMAEMAKSLAKKENVEENIHWFVGPYQQLKENISEQFDVILCHAVIEWLEHPEQLIHFLNGFLNPGGYLSLCFYNPAALVFKNLLRGNFNRAEGKGIKTTGKKIIQSLTPTNPSSAEEVKAWLIEENFNLLTVSGMRVFSDYTKEKRGALLIPEEIIHKELQFSQLEPYKWLGRYLHFMAKLN